MTDNTNNAPKAPSHAQPKDKLGRFTPNAKGKTRKALDLMASEGIDDRLAAKRAGCRLDNLRRTLRMPENIAYLNQAINDVRQNAGQKAFMRNVHLAQTASSEHVRADLNKWIAGVDNIAPVTRVDGRMTHTHTFGGFDFEPAPPVDVTPTDTKTVADDDKAQ